MVIFHSYVSLPEGTIVEPKKRAIGYQFGIQRLPQIRPGAPWPCPCRTADLSSP